MSEASILSWKTTIGYANGHILNDLVAALWFSYSLLFYKLAYGTHAYIFLVIGKRVMG